MRVAGLETEINREGIQAFQHDERMVVVFSQGVHMVTTIASGVDQGGQAVVVDVTAYAFDVDDAGRSVDVYRSRSVGTTRPDDDSRQGDGHERETCLLGRRSLEAGPAP
jgi:hypothetical protein